jgi:tetraacyldisaccharide 4'-kinase
MKKLDSRSGKIMPAVAGVLESAEKAYATGLKLYLLQEKVGLRKRFAVPVPTISIGNLSVGGTGKTPATIAIGRSLQQIGYKVAVISRGHGGTASRTGAVVSNESGTILLTVAESGDEPMLLALSLPGIPVIVGKDRRNTAKLALRLFKPDLLLLDDGFQYWQLKRDVDIVLLDAENPFGNGHCLPRGLLREPMTNLSRAQIVVVTRSSELSENEKEIIKGRIAQLAPKSCVFFAHHMPGSLLARNEAARIMKHPRHPFAVSAVARPESFLHTLQEVGITPVGVLTYGDHHDYKETDAAQIVGRMTKVGADYLLTTEKDSVKLEQLLPLTPIFVQTIHFRVLDPVVFLANVLGRLGLPTNSIAETAVS